MSLLDDDEKKLVAYLWERNGRAFKRSLSLAWQTGDYSRLGASLTESQVSTLQFLRNSRGPGWLSDLRRADVGL